MRFPVLRGNDLYGSPIIVAPLRGLPTRHDVTAACEHAGKNDMEEMPPVAAGTPAPPLAALRALPYHDEVVALLRRQEPEAWAWASSAAARSDRAQEVRAFLLQHTYRLDMDAHPQLHACCTAAA